jgi:hypothetical protein
VNEICDSCDEKRMPCRECREHPMVQTWDTVKGAESKEDITLRQQAIDTIEARVADYSTGDDVSPYWGGGIANPNKYIYYKLRYIWTTHPEDREMVIEQYMRGIKNGSIDPQNPLPHGEPNQHIPSQWNAESFSAIVGQIGSCPECNEPLGGVYLLDNADGGQDRVQSCKCGWYAYGAESEKRVKNTYRIGDRELKEYTDGSMEIVMGAESIPYKSAWAVAKRGNKGFSIGQVAELRMYENGEITLVIDDNLYIPFYDKAVAKAYIGKYFHIYSKRPYREKITLLQAEDDHDHDHDHDHEEIDDLINKLNTITDFAITFIHDGGYGGEPQGTIVDESLGLRTEIIHYIEGSIDLRMVRDINTNELMSVRFALTGDPDETPIIYLPLPEELTTTPEDERS